jgi:hypothetical protein
MLFYLQLSLVLSDSGKRGTQPLWTTWLPCLLLANCFFITMPKQL